MNRKDPMRVGLTAIAVCGLLVVTQHQGAAQTSPQYSVASRPATANASRGVVAIDSAARNGKYLFIFFWKANDEQSQTMYGVFQSAMEQVGRVGRLDCDSDHRPQ